jgi:hypothetical protein
MSYSIYHYLSKHGKSTKPFKSSYKEYKSHRKIKIVGNTFGKNLNILPLNFTICITLVLTFVWIWDPKCTNKIKVFGWLLLMDMLNVRNILKRKRYKLERNDYTCVLCSRGVEETTFRLFFGCPFSQ